MRRGTSGDTGGMSGWLARGTWRLPHAVALALLGAACVVNVTSKLHDTHGRLPVWQPVVWETSSLAAALGSVWIIFGLVDLTQRRGIGWPAVLPLHMAAATAFSALHCIGMWSLRRVAYTIAGCAYGWTVPLGQVFYEYRKDLLTYAVVALVYRATQRVREPEALPAAKPARAMFDIRDGAKLVRVPMAEIVAVSSAGNYVEFVMANGRRVLMRGTLAGVLAALAPAGFLRVHRSWIVNEHQVRGVAPDGSGDYTLTLAGGVVVPLSRRFPEALRQLRGPVLQAAG